MPLRDLNGRRRYDRGRRQKERAEKKRHGLTSRGTPPVRLVDNAPQHRIVSLDDMDRIAMQDPTIREGR
jgi:hypothetical protein